MSVSGSLQEKRGKYYAVLNLTTKDGVRKQKWICTDLPVRGNKKRAEEFLRKQLSEYNGRGYYYSDMTVDEYFETWLEDIEGEVKPNTFLNYKGNMENHIIPYFREHRIPLQELTTFDLEDYYKSGVQCKGASRSLSPMTIKHHHQNISKALTDAVRRGLIMSNPAHLAKTPKAERYKATFLNLREVEELIDLFRGSTIEIPVTLCAVYGFRRSEVLGLEWRAVDFDRRSITIEQTLQQGIGGSYISEPKTESSYRTLPMTDDIYELLWDHKRKQARRKKMMGEYYNDTNFVCTRENGDVIQPNYLTVMFHSVLEKSDLPMIRLHDLRHSVASNLIDAGFSVVQVQEWMGHSETSTTLNIYSHASKRSKMQIADALQDMLHVYDKSDSDVRQR